MCVRACVRAGGRACVCVCSLRIDSALYVLSRMHMANFSLSYTGALRIEIYITLKKIILGLLSAVA